MRDRGSLLRSADPVQGLQAVQSQNKRSVVFYRNGTSEPAVFHVLLFSRDQHDGSFHGSHSPLYGAYDCHDPVGGPVQGKDHTDKNSGSRSGFRRVLPRFGTRN